MLLRGAIGAGTFTALMEPARAQTQAEEKKQAEQEAPF
jgi:hypothetical protein